MGFRLEEREGDGQEQIRQGHRDIGHQRQLVIKRGSAIPTERYQYDKHPAIIQGTPKALWPSVMTRLNVNGMPAAAMWLQCLLVGVFIVLVSFGGDSASAFSDKARS